MEGRFRTAVTLRSFALEHDVAERAVTIPKQRFDDSHGHLLLDVDVKEFWNGVGPCLALHRAELHAVLLAGSRDIPIRMGVTLLALREHGETISADFDDESSDEYDLVIGADGIHSTVRRLAFGDDVGARPVGQLGWRFIAAASAEITTWSVLLGRRTAFLMLPIGDGRAYCYCDVVSDGDEEPEPARLFAGFAPPVPDLLESVSDPARVHRSTIEEVALDTWTRGRVVFIGDAAHATSPNMAQGAAMALEDALVLADCMRRLDTIPAAPTAFEARRRPRTD